VILVGNLNRPVKRADLFLRAAARVAQRHPELCWQVVGDGELRPGLEKLAHELGLEARVEFLGRRSDVPDLLAEAAISVNCSDSEGFSNAVLESMLAGCAVVGTDNGGNGDLITHGETGMLVPTGDAEALATAICGLIDAPDQRRRLVERARQHVAAEFDWERAVAAHQDLYARLLTRS
jgi:glycosyltransferase involved in cell wall biosynthesis